MGSLAETVSLGNGAEEVSVLIAYVRMAALLCTYEGRVPSADLTTSRGGSALCSVSL